MSGFTVVTNSIFFPAEAFEPEDEICEYELAGFQLLSELESRKLACCDWLVDGPEQAESFYNDDEELEDGASGYDECEDDYGFSVEKELVKTYGKPSTRLIRGENPTPDDEPEVEEVWQMRQVAHSYGGAENSTKRPGKNSRRPWIGDRGGSSGWDYDSVQVLAEIVVNDRRFRVSRAA